MKYGRFIERRIKIIKWFRSWVRIPGASLSFFFQAPSSSSSSLPSRVFFLSAAVCFASFWVCVCERASKLGIHLQEKSKAQAQQQQQQKVHLQKDERCSFAFEKDDLGRERKPFVLFFLFFVWSGTLDSGRNSVCVCMCHDNSGAIREEKLFFFSFLFFSFLFFALGLVGNHGIPFSLGH